MAKLWTQEEHKILQQAHDTYMLSGESWSAKAALVLPGRTAAACETRYGYLKRFDLTDVISNQLSFEKSVETQGVESLISFSEDAVTRVSEKNSKALCEQAYRTFLQLCEILGVPIETIQRDC